MITLTSLNKAVCSLYQAALEHAGVNAELVEEDLSSPIIRPSGKVVMGDTRKTRLLASGQEQSVTFRLYYFAKDRRRTKPENMAVRQAVGDLFLDGIVVDDTYLAIDEGVRFDVVDGVLVATLDLAWVSPMAEIGCEPDGGLMEALIFNKEEI